MKRKIYSIIIILCTVISIYIMTNINLMGGINTATSNKELKVNNNKIAKKNTSETVKGTVAIQNGSNKTITEDVEKKADIKVVEVSPSSSPIATSIIESPEEINKTEEITSTPSIIQKDADSSKSVEEKATNIEDEELASVFKVAVGDIEDQLTFNDKKCILQTISKLSPMDYFKIKDYLDNDINGSGVISTLKFLKGKLGDVEYSKFRTVADRFVKMDDVEKINK